MKKIEREDLYILSQHSDVSEEAIEQAFQKEIYSNKEAWGKFFRLFFMSLAAVFTLSGIIFFFAYNWADLHKFIKIGLIEVVIIATSMAALLPKINSYNRQIILTGASMLVGVLFAVFGQVYQTGANAYDFFLAWTLFITLWVVVSNFPPLWLLHIILINTTFILFTQQVVKDWSLGLVFLLLFLLNTALLIAATKLPKFKQDANIPSWFIYTLAIGVVSFATIGIAFGIHKNFDLAFLLLIIAAALGYTLGIWHGLQTKNGFYLAIIPFSLIIIGSSLLLKVDDGSIMLLIICLIIVGSVTLTIKNLNHLQKKWNNEK